MCRRDRLVDAGFFFLVGFFAADFFAREPALLLAPLFAGDLPPADVAPFASELAGAVAESGVDTTTGGTVIGAEGPPARGAPCSVTSPAATTVAPWRAESAAIFAAVATASLVELSSTISRPPLNSPSMNGFAMQS